MCSVAQQCGVGVTVCKDETGLIPCFNAAQRIREEKKEERRRRELERKRLRDEERRKWREEERRKRKEAEKMKRLEKPLEKDKDQAKEEPKIKVCAAAVSANLQSVQFTIFCDFFFFPFLIFLFQPCSS